MKEVIKSGFLLVDKKLRSFRVFNAKGKGGCTAICAVITPENIFIANLGRSSHSLDLSFQVTLVHYLVDKMRRCLARKTTNQSILRNMSVSEKQASLSIYFLKMAVLGASVILHRVNGSLAMSRCDL